MPPPEESDVLARDIPPSTVIRDRLRRIVVEASLLRRQLRLAERRECEQEKLLLNRRGGTSHAR
jgi:hypothetical protein